MAAASWQAHRPGVGGPQRLLDARSAEEDAGTVTGYTYIPLAGRIPTAGSVIDGDDQVSETEGTERPSGIEVWGVPDQRS